MIDLLSLIGMTPVNSRGNNNSHYDCKEFSGACPFGCGASDAFKVYNDLNDIPGVGYLGLFLCMGSSQGRNGCGRSGNAIDYVQMRDNVSFVEACKRLGIDANVVINYRRSQKGLAPQERRIAPITRHRKLAETDAWQATAWAFAKNAVMNLKGDPRAYLLGRGLSDKTIKDAAFGFYPQYRRAYAHTWGYEYAKDEKPFKIKLPRGIVIPWFNDLGAIICIRFRRLPDDESEDARAFYGVDERTGEIGRYKALYGSCTHLLYRGYTLKPGKPAALMEGELDAWIGEQAGVCRNVATGSTAWGRSEESLTALRQCDQVLVSFDLDPAGEKAASHWLGKLDNAHRWRPFWKDPNAMSQEGLDVKFWLELGLASSVSDNETVEPAPAVTDAPEDACKVCKASISNEVLQFFYDERGDVYCENHWNGARPETQCAPDSTPEERKEKYVSTVRRMAAIAIPRLKETNVHPAGYTLAEHTRIQEEERAASSKGPVQARTPEEYWALLERRLGKDWVAEPPKASLERASRPRSYPAPYPKYDRVLQPDGRYSLEVVGMWDTGCQEERIEAPIEENGQRATVLAG